MADSNTDPKLPVGKLVAARGEWAEYVHPGGTYWIHVTTKERVENRPTDFHVVASRDSSGRQRSHILNDPCCLYIQNIPLFWRGEDIRSHFGQFGDIVNCDAPENLQDRSVNRGYGFCTYSTAEEARHAQINMTGFQVDGESGLLKTLQVAIRGEQIMKNADRQAMGLASIFAPGGQQTKAVFGGAEMAARSNIGKTMVSAFTL